MSFESPTLDELIELEKAEYRARIPGADTSPGSDLDIDARVHASALRAALAQGEYLLRQSLPSTIDGEFLIEQCRIRGMTKAAAAGSTGRVMITSTTAGRQMSSGATLTHASGERYEATSTVSTATSSITGGTIVGTNATELRIPIVGTIGDFHAGDVITIGSEKAAVREVLSSIFTIELWAPMTSAPAAGVSITAATGAVVPIRALSTGADTNKDPRDTLTIDSPTGDTAASALILELAGGGDEEREDELRARYVEWLGFRPGAGNVADYRAWVRATPGARIADAFVYPGALGLGTIVVVPFGVEGARMVSAATISAIESYLATVAPYADTVTVQNWTYDTSISMRITVDVADDYAPDWSGSYVVGSNSTTTTVVLQAAPSAIEVGDRVLVRESIMGVTRPYQRTVTARSLTGTFSITLDSALPIAPVNGAIVDPGGPLFDAVDAAIDALQESFGPGETTPTASRYPSPDHAYTCRVRASDVIAAVKAIPGVVDVAVTEFNGTAFDANGYASGPLNRLLISNRRVVWA